MQAITIAMIFFLDNLLFFPFTTVCVGGIADPGQNIGVPVDTNGFSEAWEGVGLPAYGV